MDKVKDKEDEEEVIDTPPPTRKLDTVRRRFHTGTNGITIVFQYDESISVDDTDPMSRYNAAPTDDKRVAITISAGGRINDVGDNTCR